MVMKYFGRLDREEWAKFDLGFHWGYVKEYLGDKRLERYVSLGFKLPGKSLHKAFEYKGEHFVPCEDWVILFFAQNLTYRVSRWVCRRCWVEE